VGEYVADGDLALAVAGVLGDVGGDRRLELDEPPLHQHVDHEGRDRLRARVDEERRRRRRRDLGGVLGVLRAVSARVADRPVEDDGAVSPHAHLHGGVNAAAVERHRRLPHRLDGGGLEPARFRVGLVADGGGRVEVAGDPDSAQRVADERQAGNRGHLY
jgi:hypothetical protein